MARRRFTAAGALAAGLLLFSANASLAQESLFGRDTLHGMVEIRAGAADGEQSWTKGGFGKTALSGSGDGGWNGTAGVSQAVVEWRPRFSFAASAVISGQWQADVGPKFDFDEAYLKLKAPPGANDRLSARVGLFYPPVSLEHSGIGWTTTDLLSASALNSWIGEEVKVGGAEVSWRRRFGDHELTATAAVFGWNDTSGTLLSFRGWTLDDVRTGARTEFPLPPLSPFIARRQDDETYPNWEIDQRPGYYLRLEWRPPAPVALHVFHYDNRGNRTGERDLQWAWETRFTELGMTWAAGPSTTIRAQALSGRTWMGYAYPQTWVDMSFRAAYLMAIHDIGDGAVSARVDAFGATDHGDRSRDDNTESGWAATVGWRRRLTDWADLLVEAQHLESDRPARRLAGEGPEQVQNLLQSAVRLHF